MSLPNFEQSGKADVSTTLLFFCKIGQTEAKLFILIEPDPHGDGKGTHAHFLNVVHCPKIKIVEFPEPDRCKVTDKTCPFIEPFGGHERDPQERKWLHAHRFIGNVSSIDFYGTQLIATALKAKGFRDESVDKHFNELRLNFWQVIKLLRALDLIDEPTHKKISYIEKKRNRLAHYPDSYAEFGERELFRLSEDATELASKLIRQLRKQ